MNPDTPTPDAGSRKSAPAFHAAEIAAHAILAGKGEDVAILDLRGASDVTDFFVVATATSDAQSRTLSDSVRDDLKAAGQTMLSTESGGNLQWVLLDFVDVVVHLFQPRAREYYRIESLWSDAPRVDVDPAYFRRDDVRERHPGLRLARRGISGENPSEADPT